MKKDRFIKGDLIFFITTLFILVMSAGGHIVQGDEETMFRVTQNLVEGRGIAVGREELVLPAQPYPFLPEQDETFWTTSAVPGRDGLLYSWYGLGQSIVATPLYILGDVWENLSPLVLKNEMDGFGPRLFVAMLNPLVLAGCAWLLLAFSRELGYKNRTGKWISVAFTFSSMAWPYVNTFYPQPGVAFLILFMFFAAYKLRVNHHWRWIWGVAFSSFMVLLFRPSAVIVFPAVVIYLFLSNPKRQWLKWAFPLSIGIGSSVLITLFYNWMRFGTIFSIGYNDVISWSNPFILGLYGLLFSPGKGVFLYTPVLILCIVALIPFSQKYRFEALSIGILWLSFLGFYAGYNFWTGGFNWGPRFLLPLLPITLLTLGSLVEQQNSVLIRYFFIGLIFLGFFIQIPAVIVDHSRYLSQQLSVEDQSSAYTQTLYNMAYSPIFQQWGQTLDVLKIYSKSENWRAASDVLDRLQLAGGGTRNGKALLVSEFLRRNTLDFWWLNGFLLSPSLGNH